MQNVSNKGNVLVIPTFRNSLNPQITKYKKIAQSANLDSIVFRLLRFLAQTLVRNACKSHRIETIMCAKTLKKKQHFGHLDQTVEQLLQITMKRCHLFR